MRVNVLSLLAAAPIALAGCALPENHGSDQVATRDMMVALTAASDDAGGQATIAIDSPIGAVRITGGDALTFTAAGAPVPLHEVDDGDKILYKADLGGASGDLAFDLVRPHDHSVRDLSIRMPPPFTVVAQGLTTTQPLALTWDVMFVDYTVALSIKGACINTLERTFSSDTGAYTVGAAELEHSGPGASATCPLTVTLTRSVTLQTDLVRPPLRGGLFSAQAQQRRTVEVNWQP